ncbi:MAG: hypothetical protein JNM43_12995 [Planctomycetaceae bacterium]|nr:hypothetical protein [Planctomycetaceae bacterium]
MSILLNEPEPAFSPSDVPPPLPSTPEPSPSELQLGPGAFPGFLRPFASLWWGIKSLFGTATIVAVLAILAAIPGLNILTLGYLVEPQKRVAASGKLRDGFPLMVFAPRLGIIMFFSLLFLIPLRFMAVRVNDAAVILGANDPRTLRMMTVLAIMKWLAGIYLLLAISYGGSFSSFFRPVRNLKWFWKATMTRPGRTELSAQIETMLDVMKPFHHFWLGLKAFLGAVLWLAIPSGMLVAVTNPERDNPVLGVVSFLGVLLMIPVMAWLPLLQVHQAVEGRFVSVFSIRTARAIIARVPLRWMLATVVLYALTFPLYLAKIRLLPGDAMLLITPFFIVLTYPTRLLMAWVYHQGQQRPASAFFLWRWLIKLVMVPALGAYCFFLFLTPFVSELGRSAPLENQAFLGPVPYAQWGRSK